MNIAFLGLGNMGSPLARRLLDAGHTLTVFNRTAGRAKPLERAGAKLASSPADAARHAEVMITMVGDDDALEAVLLGEHGALGTLPRGGIHVSMSTVSPALVRWLDDRHGVAGQTLVSAPVFGRPDAVQAGKLWIVVAGPEPAVARVRPLFEAMGQGILPVGTSPSRANVVKLAGNFLLASVIEALGEAVAFARKHDLDPAVLLDIVNGKLLRSPVYENYGKMILEERYEPAGFRLRWGLKDVSLALAAAEDAGVPMPLASLMRDQYLSAMARGMGDLDWSALARVAAQNAGLSGGEASGV